MDKESKYAIHAAAREGRVAIVESLLNADPKLAFLKDEDGRLPIHWAASSNQFEIASLLVQQKNFDPDVQDDMGWTPLMIAASVKEGEKLVDLLLSKGADVNEKNTSGQVCPEPAHLRVQPFLPVSCWPPSLDCAPLRHIQEQHRPRPQVLRAETPSFGPRQGHEGPICPPSSGCYRLSPHDQPLGQEQEPTERHRRHWIHGPASRGCGGTRRRSGCLVEGWGRRRQEGWRGQARFRTCSR